MMHSQRHEKAHFDYFYHLFIILNRYTKKIKKRRKLNKFRVVVLCLYSLITIITEHYIVFQLPNTKLHTLKVMFSMFFTIIHTWTENRNSKIATLVKNTKTLGHEKINCPVIGALSCNRGDLNVAENYSLEHRIIWIFEYIDVMGIILLCGELLINWDLTPAIQNTCIFIWNSLYKIT